MRERVERLIRLTDTYKQEKSSSFTLLRIFAFNYLVLLLKFATKAPDEIAQTDESMDSEKLRNMIAFYLCAYIAGRVECNFLF